MIEYTKKPKSVEQQIELLKSRGLLFSNEDKAAKILENISYSRLSAYWYPMLKEPKEDEIFKENSYFDTVFKIYQFDSELRILVFYAIEQIEIALRTQITYQLSIEHDTGFWFEKSALFKSYPKFIEVIQIIIASTNKSNQDYIKKYKSKYTQYLPPAWKSFEILSFGVLKTIFENLEDKNMQINISNHFDLNHEVLKSWLESILYVRNVCAHHSRLWNIKLTVSPKFPRRTTGKWINKWNEIEDSGAKTYVILCALTYLMDKVNPYHKFRKKLFELIQEYESSIDLAHMGFTEDWKQQELWN
ncbi:Abi family protein [Bernardetia sp. MNP-M8]|uniref:Abi family protein n=1 Tax=Bernardetia sp. MNP-M8 TaxID=3127470 RepID=UPI0030D27DF3